MTDGIQLVGDMTVAEPEERRVPTLDSSVVVEPKAVIEPDDLPIFLEESILREMVQYSSTNLGRELGGVMVGMMYQWQGRPWLRIEGYLKADYGRGAAASFTFTHEAWSRIRAEQETRGWGDRLIVGWHHTHPGYGIFLSRMDLFIHENFFNLPWMTALVVDPKAGTFGFFQWKRGTITPCGFYYVR